MNIFRKQVDAVTVVLDVLAPVDFRFGGFNPCPNRVRMSVFLCFRFIETHDGRSDKSVRAVVLAARDPLLNKPFNFRR
jgi:hypothetical protein